jgi:hypothetical protein
MSDRYSVEEQELDGNGNHAGYIILDASTTGYGCLEADIPTKGEADLICEALNYYEEAQGVFD